MSDECERITAYLTGGGFFNPEFANHDAVRDLLIDCRAAIAAAPSDRIAGLERENVELKTKCAMLSGALRATFAGTEPPKEQP